MGKVILWELCKKLMFDHTKKCYMHNPKSVLENDTHKFLRDFEIQTDHLITARRPDILMINKNEIICRIVDFFVPADYRVKMRESEKRGKYLYLAMELKKKL